MIWKGPGLLPDEMWPAREPQATHRYMQLSDGERARIVESGRSDGPPVLFLHGWGASAYMFRRNLIPIGDAGFRAIAVDLRGHGLSDKPLREGAYTLEAMCAHVLRIMDGLELDRASIVGQSMSGRIALELGLTSPDRVERVALIDPIGLGVLRGRGIARIAALPIFDPFVPYLVSRAVIKLGLRSIYGRAKPVSEEDVEEYWAPARFPSFARALSRLLREFSWELISEERLHELGIPALVVFGKMDRLVRADPEGPLLQEREGFAVRFLEDAGHVANEELADEVNDALLAFLAGEAPPPSRARASARDADPNADATDGEREPADGKLPGRPRAQADHDPERTEEHQLLADASGDEHSSGRKRRRRRKLRQRRGEDES